MKHAAKDVKDGYFKHACFEAQQAALKQFDVRLPNDLIQKAKIIDQYYIPTRYPNGFESGAPMDFYTEEQADDAVGKAKKIINWCADFLRSEQK